MNSYKKMPLLEERASAQVAINLCQENGFKEIVLCLEKPTYGYFINNDTSTLFINTKQLSIFPNQEYNLPESYYLDKEVVQWEAAIEEHCQRLTKRLPYSLKYDIHASISRIALEYLSYCRRHEILFGISRYFLMNIFTERDWIKAGRLDEEKLAKQLLLDDRLTVLQRFRIACVYSLYADIPKLWKNLTWKERQLIGRNGGNHYLSKKNDYLIYLWFDYLKEHKLVEAVSQNKNLWFNVVKHAIQYGNLAILMPCWKMLDKHTQQLWAVNMALKCVRKWQATQNKRSQWNEWKQNLFSKAMRFQSLECFNLPTYYSELISFFLSEMQEEQKLIFFQESFKSKFYDSVLNCFLNWPLQNEFLPLMNQLWEITPKSKYGECLLTLASKYSGDYDYDKYVSSASLDIKGNHGYDYRSLLWRLWEETPQKFKRYLFRHEKPRVLIDGTIKYETVVNQGSKLLPRLLKKSPFQRNDEALFEQIWCDLQEDERMMILYTKSGEDIFSILIQKENVSFMKCLLEACSKEKIPCLKKKFIQSYSSYELCINMLRDKRESSLEDLIEWSFELDTEKSHFKYNLFFSSLSTFAPFLIRAEYAEVERMINFCASSNEEKELLKISIIKNACSTLLESCKWEQLDSILAWNFHTEEKIKDFKKELISSEGFCAHHSLVYISQDWKNIECFYKWFCLSAEEINEIKTETLFQSTVIDDIEEALYKGKEGYFVKSLLWCSTSKEMVMRFKKEFEESCFKKKKLCKREKIAKEDFNHLINELLYYLEEEVIDHDTSSQSDFIKCNGEKRSIVIEDESASFPRKRLK